MAHHDPDLKIIDIKAYPTSFPVKPADSISLGVGRVVKRDAVIVKVTTAGGVTGYGESHHGRAPGTVAHLVNTTLRQLVLGTVLGNGTLDVGGGRRFRQAHQIRHPHRYVSHLLNGELESGVERADVDRKSVV